VAAEASALAAGPCPGAASAAIVQQLQLEVAALSGRLQAAEHSISLMQRQLTAAAATAIRLEDSQTAAQLQLQELLAAKALTAELSDSISMLHTRQQQLQQRQHLGECQRSVVFKCPSPLPTDGTAQHVQQLLRKQLQLTVTVQAVHPLGGRQRSDSSSSGASRATSKHAYKVVLGSSGQRTEVMRIKAQRLRGTPLSIDELLTPNQLASRQRLQPVARQAAAAGQRVRWRHGSLLIDGKPYTGPGSLPTPAEQTAAATAQAGNHSPQPAAAQTTADGWQTVERRGSKGKPPAATSSKKALFAAQPPGKQQQRNMVAKKAGNVSKPKPQPKGANDAQPKAPSSSSAAKPSSGSGSSSAAKPSSGSGSSGNGKQQQPAGGAGGALARVASPGEGQGDTSAPAAQPAAGHGVSPPNAEPSLAAADGATQQTAAAGTAGREQPPAAAAGASAPPSPSSRA